MGRCTALYTKAASRPPRSRVEIGKDALWLHRPDGGRSRLSLETLDRFEVDDACCSQRFVRHMTLTISDGIVELITPPDEGAIAPRALRLPAVTDDAVIVARPTWEAIHEWLLGKCRLAGRTMRELARLARVATPQFAISIGEWAAHVASEMTWERGGPMRSGVELSFMLRPLEEAARESPRARDALVAAMSRLSRVTYIPRRW